MIVARRIRPTLSERLAQGIGDRAVRLESWLNRVELDTLICRTWIGHTRPWQSAIGQPFICRRCRRAYGGVRL